MQKAPIHQSHANGWIKISQTIFEKGHQRNIPVKFLQNLASGFGEEDFLRITSCPCSARSTHVYVQIKISRTVFEKGNPRNIPVKLFQNVTSGFRKEDFLWTFSCLYSAKSPHSPEPCLWMDQNFANKFCKGSHKEHSREIISKSDQRFQRRRFFKNFFMSIKCKKPQFTRAMFMEGPKFREQFLKRVTQGIFLWNYFKIWPVVSEKEDFLRISSCTYSARSPHVYGRIKISRTIYEKGSPKEHFCEISLKLDQWFQRGRFLKNCLKNSISLP